MKYVFTSECKQRSFMTNLYEIKEEIWLYEIDGEISEDEYVVSKFYKRDTGEFVMGLVSFGPEFNPSNGDDTADCAVSDIREKDGEDVFVFMYDPNDNYSTITEPVNAVFRNLDSHTTRDTIIHSLSNLEIEDLKNLFGENGLLEGHRIGVRPFYDSSSDYLTTEMKKTPVSSKVNLLTVFMTNDKNNIDKIEAEWELINSFCHMGEFITSFSYDNNLDGLCFTLMSL